MRACLALVLLLAVTPGASAITVQMREQVENDGGRTYVYGSVEVKAAPGEVNTVELGHRQGAMVITDATAPITGEGRCRNADPHTLTGIEDVYGGRGADLLIGDEGPNRLDGNRGRDGLHGGGGDDHLVSTAASTERRPNARAALYGPDGVSGGAGDDRIETQATLESEVTCGDGADRVVMPGFSSDRAPSSRGPLVSATCERLAMDESRSRGRGVSITPYPAAAARGALVFRVHRFACCRQRMELQTVGRRPRVLAAATLRQRTVRLRVRGADRRGALRAKVTNVSRNRFVWRFQPGF